MWGTEEGAKHAKNSAVIRLIGTNKVGIKKVGTIIKSALFNVFSGFLSWYGNVGIKEAPKLKSFKQKLPSEYSF